MAMSEIDSTLRPPVDLGGGPASSPTFWQVPGWLFSRSWRKYLIAVSRAGLDAFSAGVALVVIDALLSLQANPHSLGPLLFGVPVVLPLIFMVLGVYQDCGCGPVERVRLRVLGIALLLAIVLTLDLASSS